MLVTCRIIPPDGCHYVCSLCKKSLAQMFLWLYRPEFVFQCGVWTNNLYTTFSYCCAVNTIILCLNENIYLCIKNANLSTLFFVHYALRKRLCFCQDLSFFFWMCREQSILGLRGTEVHGRGSFRRGSSQRTDVINVICEVTTCHLFLISINIHLHFSSVLFLLLLGLWLEWMALGF